ncbi:hypothetical protein GCM10012275_45060 [Longimycelium tulufanense]|uniref:DUF2505 domain-containing protein n=1 Tax=Longimycelium tulufanense TaxID=907463 RepID=A0A8J3CHZ0_9PSEU|nr:DUF2505 domain-containing protein [Longimycelium tulufanense]GGM69597.1 hypothetical protein GCM10012275_45060 [Longimycelium tulufanense]
MATSTETAFDYPRPAAEVRAALVDEAYLRARLDELGGLDAELVVVEPSGDGGGKAVLRQGVPSDKLPSFVQAVVGGDLVIERTEVWQPTADGATATVHATVPRTPAVIDGTVVLTDHGEGCRARIRITATVKVPFVGGKVEAVVIDQVRTLLVAEHAFTVGWLDEQR